jgi:uncharacterized protein YgfB (UPF0149 family)
VSIKLRQVHGSTLPLAEVHGAVCGLLCASGRIAAVDWLRQQLELFPGSQADIDEAASILAMLESSSWEALRGVSLEFHPLLPDENSILQERVEALSYWCLGFMSGLGLGGWRESDPERANPEIDEILRDFGEISKAGMSQSEQADFDMAEFSFFELAEYVRIGVQFVFETLAQQFDEPEAPTIH